MMTNKAKQILQKLRDLKHMNNILTTSIERTSIKSIRSAETKRIRF